MVGGGAGYTEQDVRGEYMQCKELQLALRQRGTTKLGEADYDDASQMDGGSKVRGLRKN